MTGPEWVEVFAVIKGNWPNVQTPGDAVEIQYQLVKDVDRDDAIRVVAALAAEGERFPPTAGQIVARLNRERTPPRPSGEQALALLVEAVGRVDRSVYARDFAERHQATIDWLAEQDPVLAAYAARRGLCGSGSFGHEPLSDSQIGGAVRHRLEGEVQQSYRVAEERVRIGLPAVDPGQLIVRDTSNVEGGMVELLDRLRPAEQIESGGEKEQ